MIAPSTLIRTDAPEWAGLRLAVRMRLAGAVAHLLLTNSLNRADLMRIGEVSAAQAAIDLRTMQERVPWLMAYDKSGRTYRLAREQKSEATRPNMSEAV